MFGMTQDVERSVETSVNIISLTRETIEVLFE